MTGRLLIAGVGNIFLGDDGFGVEVANRLAAAALPAWVRVADYGIRGMHLAYDLADGYDAAILIDAVARGGEPGAIYVIEPELPSQAAAGAPPLGGGMLFNAHGMQPDVVLEMLGMLGGRPAKVLVVGCEPASVAEGMGLSEPVAAAAGKAVDVVLGLVAAMQPGQPGAAAADTGHAAADGQSPGTTGGVAASAAGGRRGGG